MKTSQANMYVDIKGAWRVVEGVQLKQILVIMKVGHKQLTAKKNTPMCTWCRAVTKGEWPGVSLSYHEHDPATFLHVVNDVPN